MSRLWLNNLFLWVEEHLCQEPQAPLPLARIFEGLQHSIAHIPGLQKGEEAHVDWKWLTGLVYAGTGGKKNAKSRQRSGSTFAALSDLGRCDMNRPFVIYSQDMNCLTGPIVWGCARCVWRPCFALNVSTSNRQDLRKEVGKSKIRRTIWWSKAQSSHLRTLPDLPVFWTSDKWVLAEWPNQRKSVQSLLPKSSVTQATEQCRCSHHRTIFVWYVLKAGQGLCPFCTLQLHLVFRS